ncbi:MAG: hypothetical protein JNM93_04145 [Bacteriovoracaceae bacterium]|nr:hypothetical protein [Bacteriovoracaceae bacterium]
MLQNLSKLIAIFNCSIFSLNSYALECEWWQTKVKAAKISQHEREGYHVSKHPRKEHCRERWKSADHYIHQFKDDPIIGWNKKGENFKKWNLSEMQTLLELLPKLPAWVMLKDYSFRRADKSIHQGNLATSELTKKTIIFYDNFFTYEDKLGAIGHEASHFIFPSLTSKDVLEFSNLSGWDVEIKGGKVYAIPPKQPLKPDSVINKEEDFTNYMELYISNPKKLKERNPKIFDFLSKRYPR